MVWNEYCDWLCHHSRGHQHIAVSPPHDWYGNSVWTEETEGILETRGERLLFLTYEWSLIIGWMLAFGLIWRQSLLFIYFEFISLGDAAQFTYLISMLVLFVGAVATMGLMGMWLQRRPTAQPLLRRWLIGLGWFALVNSIGYGIILVGLNT